MRREREKERKRGGLCSGREVKDMKMRREVKRGGRGTWSGVVEKRGNG